MRIPSQIGQGEFDLNPGLERIAGILSGDEATIDGCDKLTGQWYRLLLAKCYYSCPTIDPRTIIHSSASPNSIEHTILADLINRIFELEKVGFFCIDVFKNVKTYKYKYRIQIFEKVGTIITYLKLNVTKLFENPAPRLSF
mgnify:CR=1 FL=1